MTYLGGTLAIFAFSIWIVWLMDRWKFHLPGSCGSCKQLRRLDRNGWCRHCYEHDGGWC